MPSQGTLLKLLKRVFNHTLEQECGSTGQNWGMQLCVCLSRDYLLVLSRNQEGDPQMSNDIGDPPANGQPGNGEEGQDGCIMHQSIHCIDCCSL